jgi:hypothetical protein
VDGIPRLKMAELTSELLPILQLDDVVVMPGMP